MAYSDTYTLANYLRAVVNSGFGGWVWAPEVRDAKNDDDFARRSQLMLFSALSSMDGWYTGFTPFVPDVSPASATMFAALSAERAALKTFLFSAYQRQTVSGVPVARHVVVDYDDDAAALSVVDDQYLLGDGLMVAPVIATNATQRVVVFPRGDTWQSYWNRSIVYGGGTALNVSAPQTVLPLFQRAGSVVPLLPRPDEKSSLVLRLADVGRSGTSVVYDDDGKTTRATTHDERFLLTLHPLYEAQSPRRATTGSTSGTTGSRTSQRLRHLVAHVDAAGWTPTEWGGRLRWEVVGDGVASGGAASESNPAHPLDWSGVRCNGVAVPRFATEVELSASATKYGWAALSRGEIEALEAVPHARAAPRFVLRTPLVSTLGWGLDCVVVRAGDAHDVTPI